MSSIVMCADHGASDMDSVEGTTVIAVTDLCRRLGQLGDLVPPEETSLLLAVHGSETETGRIQAAVRRLGFDALGVGVLDLERFESDEAVANAIVALRARMDAYPGSLPEQVKLAPRPTRTTRRSVLSPGAPAYTGAPKIDGSRCVANAGCRACVSACPVAALGSSGGAVTYDKSACIACGICVTTCPPGAVVNPVATPAALEAEIRAAVEVSSRRIGIRFVCRSSQVHAESGWHDVEVPCTGMLTVGWLLAPLLVGASAVSAVTCEESECSLGLSARATVALGEAQEVLTAIGIDATRLGGDRLDFPPLMPMPAPSGIFDPGSTQRAIAALHECTHIDPGFVALGSADIGTVDIDVSSCTACEMCANVCPTDALRSTHDRDGVRIDFDVCDCVACGQCIAVCPEIDRGAITFTVGFDPSDWKRGRRELRHEATASCDLCGEPVAPAAMLDRISAILGEEHSGTIAVIGNRCIACRGR
jgi:ferredoxin